MKNKFTFFILAIFFTSCNLSGWKHIDFEVFDISVPKDWRYEKIRSFDSFAGQIVGENLKLTFDYTGMGYANSLVPTELDYLNVLWLQLHDHPSELIGPSYSPDAEILYKIASDTRKSVLSKQNALAKAGKKPNDTAITFINAVNVKLYKDSIPDFNAIIKYNGKTDTVPVYIPRLIKQHNITVDTAGKYVSKTIWPKVAGKGTTGLFVYRTDSNFTFMICGENLTLKDERLALKAFKTIKFK